MVNFEAARAICEMKNVTTAQLTKPIAGVLTVHFIMNITKRYYSAIPAGFSGNSQTCPEIRHRSYPC